MIAAYHLIWAAYGCWLPNDPRGSMSQEMRVDKLAPLGEVDESVYVDPERPLTLYSYNVYGPARIASISITLNRRDPSASESARKIVKGLRWKKNAGAAPEKTRKRMQT